MKQPVERRLAAILAADVAGYSRLMGAGEDPLSSDVSPSVIVRKFQLFQIPISIMCLP